MADLDPLGVFVRKRFDEAAAARLPKEQEWLKDLRQAQGRYEPEVEAAIGDGRSRAYPRLTHVKVRTMDARIFSILFPAGKEKNWGISPTPKPRLSPERMGMAIEKFIELTGTMPLDSELDFLASEYAKAAALGMEKVIEDQLVEASYTSKIRKVMHSGHLYGTGIIKGPLVEKKIQRRWQDEGASWAMTDKEIMAPWVDYVSVWDGYPDPESTSRDDMEFFIQRHTMNKTNLKALRKNGFNAAIISRHVTNYPEGDAKLLLHESERIAASDGITQMRQNKRRYEMLEYWGPVEASLLKECGCDVGDDEEDVEACVWVLGHKVVKAARNPFDSQTKPFYFYVPSPDENSIFGISVPSSVRDSQAVAGAAWRMTIDNAAQTVGPMAEVNLDLLEIGEDPRSIHPFRVFLRRGSGVEAQHRAVNFYSPPSTSRETIAIFDRAKQMVDEESTIPSYMHGDADKGGAGNTLGGLQILTGASNVTLGDAAQAFDFGITKPLISALGDWNMQFNEDESIKGDYEFEAKGSSTLIAKELKAQQLQGLALIAERPAYAPYFNHQKLALEIERELNISGVVREESEMQNEQPGLDGQMPGGQGFPGGQGIPLPPG